VLLHFREAQEIPGCQVLLIAIADKKSSSVALANL
jgi:hypothetical protein